MAEQRPREHRQDVTDLATKIDEIIRRFGCGSRAELCKRIAEVFPAAELKERDFGRQVTEGRMNETYLRCLCEFIGLSWETQRQILQDGTVEELKEALDKVGNGVELVEDDRFVDPDKIGNDLAMVTVFAPSNAPSAGPGAAYISFTLNCPKPAGPDEFCVKVGWLEFDLGTGNAPHVSYRAGFEKDGVTFNNARLSTHDPDTHRPSWHVEAVNGDWIGMVADVPAVFLLARGLTPPHIIRGSFRAYVSGVSFANPGSKTEGVNKARLKKRLKQMKIIPDDDGKVVLASLAMRLKAKPQSPKK